jgi:hypothetical protein
MHRLKFNRWLYFAVVTMIGIGCGVVAATVDGWQGQICYLVGAMLVTVLTYPAGIVGAFCGMPFLYMGLATQAEVLAISAPASAIAGMLQWYVILPRIFAHRASAANAEPGPTTPPPSD